MRFRSKQTSICLLDNPRATRAARAGTQTMPGEVLMGSIAVAGSENGTGNKTNRSGRRREGSVLLSSFTPSRLNANPCWNV
jgi:hypothetical protein